MCCFKSQRISCHCWAEIHVLALTARDWCIPRSTVRIEEDKAIKPTDGMTLKNLLVGAYVHLIFFMFLKLGTIFLHKGRLCLDLRSHHMRRRRCTTTTATRSTRLMCTVNHVSKPCQAQVPTLDCNLNPGLVLICATVSSVLGR